MYEKKLFIDPKLNLAKLANALQVKPYLLTKCLSIRYRKKFSTYINEKRINELKTLLKDEKNKNITLLGLAFDVGFNSKASFNRSVKQITGKPPSALKSDW